MKRIKAHECRVPTMDCESAEKCEECKTSITPALELCLRCDVSKNAVYTKCGDVALVKVKDTGSYYCEEHVRSFRMDANHKFQLIYLDKIGDMWKNEDGSRWDPKAEQAILDEQQRKVTKRLMEDMEKNMSDDFLDDMIYGGM